MAHEASDTGRRRLAVSLSLLYGALFIVAGTKLPYLPVWLDARGLTAAEIALITAAPLFVRIAATPVLAFAVDAHGDRRLAIVALSWLTLGALIGLGLAGGFWPILGIAVLLALATTSVMPLAETIAMTGVRTAGLDYGRMRLWGSLSFIAASFATGLAIDRWGAEAVIGLLILGGVCCVAVAHMLPRMRPEATAPEVAGPRVRISDVVRLCRARPFLMFLIAAGSVQAAHAVFYTFGVLQWREQGLSPGWAGVLWAIGVVSEILLFAFSGAALRKVGAVSLILLGALAGVVRWTLMGFDPPLVVLAPLQVLHGLTFGAAHLGAVHFISQAVPPAQTGTVQGLYATVSSGVAMGLATLVAGPLYDAVRGKAYLAMALLAAVGLMAALDLRRRYPRGAERDAEA